MQDLLEIVEDLETLAELEGTPGFWAAFEDIAPKWQERKIKAEEDMERQFTMLFD
jgi:hypothetical protein